MLAAGGSWIANVYFSAKAGTWTVTGNYGGLIDTATLTVNAGALHHIVISPDSATVTAGNAQPYTAQSFDQFDNPMADVTANNHLHHRCQRWWQLECQRLYLSQSRYLDRHRHLRRAHGYCQPDG